MALSQNTPFKIAYCIYLSDITAPGFTLICQCHTISIEARCAQIAAEHGLTPRETEVFTLLARGRDVGFVCAELYISRNTANAHRRAIYSKLGIHSQQELLNIVEGGLGGQ